MNTGVRETPEGRRTARSGARTAGTGYRYAQSRRHHDEMLREPAFNRLESRCFARTVRRSVDDIVGLQPSFSYSSPARLGERVPAFTEAVREALAWANPSGE